MTENKKLQFAKADDEVDLMLLLAKFIHIIKKYLVLIVCITFVGILAGFGLYYIAPPGYNSRMIADSGILPNTEVINIVESWQGLLKKSDHQVLAEILKLSPDVTRKIRFIEAENTTTIKGTKTAPEEDKTKQTFTIHIQVSDVNVLDTLEYAFIYFLENNKYVQYRSELKKQQLERLRAKIINEIADLDSTKMSIKNILRSNLSVSNKALLTNPAELNVHSINLYEKLLDTETQLRFVNDIQIVESFTKSSKPDEPKLFKNLVMGGFVAFVTACLIVIVIMLSKQIKKISLQNVEA